MNVPEVTICKVLLSNPHFILHHTTPHQEGNSNPHLIKFNTVVVAVTLSSLANHISKSMGSVHCKYYLKYGCASAKFTKILFVQSLWNIGIIRALLSLLLACCRQSSPACSQPGYITDAIGVAHETRVSMIAPQQCRHQHGDDRERAGKNY